VIAHDSFIAVASCRKRASDKRSSIWRSARMERRQFGAIAPRPGKMRERCTVVVATTPDHRAESAHGCAP
jgi:hypothetical protein